MLIDGQLDMLLIITIYLMVLANQREKHQTFVLLCQDNLKNDASLTYHSLFNIRKNNLYE